MNKETLKAYAKAYMEVYVKPDIKELLTPIQHEVILPEVPEGERERVNNQVPNHNDQTNNKSQIPNNLEIEK